MLPERVVKMSDADNMRMTINENKICSAVGQVLEKHYPGYRWYVNCEWWTGVVTVKNLNIHGDYGFVLYLQELLNDLELNGVMRAGGELLERCNLPRRNMRPEEVFELKRDLRGNVTAESMNMDTKGGEY